MSRSGETPRRRISRQGLSVCPDCGRFFQLAEHWRSSICPFCAARFVTRPQQRRFPGRGGALAAGMLSLATGCIDRVPAQDDEPDQAVQSTDHGPDQTGPVSKDAGPSPDASPAPDASPPIVDRGARLDLGIPDAGPLDAGSQLDSLTPDAQPDQAPPDALPSPLDAVAPDAMRDPEPAPEPADMPDYGIPCIPEEEIDPPDAGVDMAVAPDAGPMPEYGAPPTRPTDGFVGESLLDEEHA